MLHFLILVSGTMLTVLILSGFLSGYAVQRNFQELRASTVLGAISGVTAAVALALFEYTSAFIVREYYNLILLCVVLAAEAALLIMLVVTRSKVSEKAASRAKKVVFFIIPASWGAFYLPDIFIYPSQFAVGVTQVASSEFVLIVAGYLFGIGLCLLVGYAVFRVSAALPSRIIFPLFILALLAFGISQSITLGQILLGRGLIPRNDLALDGIIFLLNNASVLLYWIIGAAALASVILWLRTKKSVAQGLNAANPALRRKAVSLMLGCIRWSKTAILALLTGLLTMTVGVDVNAQKVELSPPLTMPVTDGVILHSTATVGDGALHRFVYKTAKGVDVRYIIIKKSETAYGVGLDACDVCGPSGYYERKGQVVCILCDVVMNKSTIGFAGGCNPVPLKFSLKAGNLIINTADLEAEASRFL